MGLLFRKKGEQFFDENGEPLENGYIQYKLAGTNDDTTVYQNAAGSVAHAATITLNGSGRLLASVYLGGADVKELLFSSDGVQQHSEDGYPASGGASSGEGGSTSSLGHETPIGAIVYHSLGSVPDGWLRIKKDPQALLKSAYPELNASYLAQAYPYGSTTTTFNIPGGAGLFVRAWDSLSTWDVDAADRLDHATAASVVGNLIGSRQLNQNKAHTHGPGSLATDTEPAHTHGYGNAGGLTVVGNDGVTESVADETGGTTGANGAHNHAVTTGITDANGGTDARPDNVAFPLIILVNPSIAAQNNSVVGLAYAFNDETDASDPSAGNIALDNASLGLATQMFVSKTDAYGQNLTSLWEVINTISGPARAIITLRGVGASGTGLSAIVTGAVEDLGAYIAVPISVTSSGGGLFSGDNLVVGLSLSGIGVTGATGPNTGLDYKFSTTTTDANPGAGYVRANNAALASATFLYVSKTGRNGEALGGVLDTLDASSNASDKASLRIFALSDRTKFIDCTVNATLTDATTYWKIPITVTGSGATPGNDDILCFNFARTGNTPTTVTVQEFTASGTWTNPGCKMIRRRGVGGGGGGGGVTGLAANIGAASGGAAGGEFDGWQDATSLTTVSVTIGAPGVGGAAGANNGTAGGATSFGAFATANGGAPGLGAAAGTALAITAQADGGTAASADIAGFARKGAASSAGLRLSGAVGLSGKGADSSYGQGGNALAAAGAGAVATGFGSGGGGALSTAAVNQPGGNGQGGYLIIEEYY
jgi:hypothetical protein